MKNSKFAIFKANVASFLARNEVKAGCHGPAKADSEPCFSHRPCDCCGSKLGGNRENYSFASNIGQFQAEICSDCVYYLAYGRLNDMTMMEIEKSN